MNLPNRITLARLVLAILLFVLLGLHAGDLIPLAGAYGLAAFVIFVVAASTDWVDGFVARRLGQVTALGRILDPFVDKVVTCGSLVYLTALWPHLVPAWFTVVVIAREFFVNALRSALEGRGVAFGAAMPGKIKMVLQSVLVGAVLFLAAIGTPGSESSEIAPRPTWVLVVIHLAFWGTLFTTLQSAWFYATRAIAHRRELQ